MSRIGTYGASQMYLSRLNVIQNRLLKEQLQVSTELKSTTYSGISSDANRVINLENERNRAKSYMTDNSLAETRLTAANVSMTAIDTALTDFKKRLDQFATTSNMDQDKVEQMQKWAYEAMVDLQSYLAVDVDGQYIFSGGRVSDEPVRLPSSSLEEFQNVYDGVSVTYPTSRSASLFDLDTTNSQTGDISFDAATGTINAPSLTTSPNILSEIPAGTRITVADSASGSNDGKSFTVRGVTVDASGTHLDVSPLTTVAGASGTVTFTDASGTEQSVAATMDFSAGADTITITPASGMTAGQVFKVSGSGANDGSYEVASVVAGPPETVTIKGTKVTTQAASSTISLKAESWYKGDTLSLQHRIDTDRSVEVGIYASSPAFEKAFRALGLLAQGAYGTAGGLENNLERVDQARFLLQDAIERNGNGIGPLGQEDNGDLHGLQTQVGVTMNVIDTKNDKHKSFVNFLDTRIADLERVDKTEAVATLLDDQTALQTSYQAIAAVRGMTLLDYIK